MKQKLRFSLYWAGGLACRGSVSSTKKSPCVGVGPKLPGVCPAWYGTVPRSGSVVFPAQLADTSGAPMRRHAWVRMLAVVGTPGSEPGHESGIDIMSPM